MNSAFASISLIFLVNALCSAQERNIADDEIIKLVKSINDNPDLLHSDLTPAVFKLIDKGLPSVPYMLKLMKSDSQETRLRASRVLSGVTMAQHGFAIGQGWTQADGEKNWRKLWEKLGSLSYDDPPEKRLKSIILWEKWLAEMPSEAADVLHEAAEIALKQDWSNYWHRAFSDIATVQIQAKDSNGALATIQGMRDPEVRLERLVRVAQALARDGKREQALEVLRPVKTERGWREYFLDEVNLSWIDHLVSSGDLQAARQSIDELDSKKYRAQAFGDLALAYSKSGDGDRAAEYLAQAEKIAETLSAAYDRARTYSEVASLAAKMKNNEAARRLFQQARNAQQNADSGRKRSVLRFISEKEAEAGFVDDALRTASLLGRAESILDRWDDDGTLRRIAVAQLATNDTEGALRTAAPLENPVRDDWLGDLVAHKIAKREFGAAIAEAGKIVDASKKAVAILKVATAHAKLGDRKTATAVAARVELTHGPDYLLVGERVYFDYRLPQTWGVTYSQTNAFTTASHFHSVRLAAEVAEAAMILAQALDLRPEQSYAVLFEQITSDQIIRAVARAHASAGDAKEALTWAKQLGSAKSNAQGHEEWPALEQRIYALVGVAEGILARAGEKSKSAK